MRRMVAMIAATRSACAGFDGFGDKSALLTRARGGFGAKTVDSRESRQVAHYALAPCFGLRQPSHWREQQGLDPCLLEAGDLFAALRQVANDCQRLEHPVRNRPDCFVPRSPLPRLAEL